MSNILIFLDIDGTLLDENYRSNDNSLKETISRLQADGVTFCLNSNRSLEDLIPIAEKFSIKGQLIGENGVFSFDATTRSTKYFVESSHLSKFVTNKNLYEEKVLNELKSHYGKYDVKWINTDTVVALINKTKFKNEKENSIIVLNNIYRKYTSSIHILNIINGKIVPISTNDLIKIATNIQAQANKDKSVNIGYSTSFSNILISPHEVAKRLAVSRILDDYKDRKVEVFAISDELLDYEMIRGVGTFYTLKNASDETKMASNRVAVKPYSKGVNELLNYIEKTYK